MSALESLLLKFTSSSRSKELNTLMSKPAARVRLTGAIGGQEAFIIAGCYLNAPQTYLIVLNDKEEAAYLHNTLDNILGETRVHLLPDSFKRPQEFEVLENVNVLQRTEIVNKLSSLDKAQIIVTYPEALFEKVVAPAELMATRLDIEVGNNLHVDFITELLVEYGFSREEFVYEPGQFAIRGSIVDIFTYGNEWPYRIELFDEEIESIRTFDPTSQLSKQSITSVAIVPNINTRFKQEQKVLFTEVLPEKAVVWIRDFDVLQDRQMICYEKAMTFADSVSVLDKTDLAEIFRDRAFVRPGQLMEHLGEFPMIALAGTYFPEGVKPKEVKVNGKPQPSFNRNFPLLIENLLENTANTLDNYLFTENEKQIVRFQAIFKDLEAKVSFHPIIKDIHEGFIDMDLNVACYTDHQIFERFHRYKLRTGFTKDQAINLRLLREMQPGDFVTHIDHGVGRYSGLEKITVNGHVQESVRLIYRNSDLLYVSINALHKISKYIGKEGSEPQLSKLGSDTWSNLKRKTKKKVKDIAGELIKLYAKRKASLGHAFPPDGYLQNELEASFLYEDTPDQLKTTIDVKEDMEKLHPMDRLICGDVGFGKTEIAVRAAFKAVTDGKQVAILVPTTILALQHYRTFSERLEEFGIKIDYINRFRSTAEKKLIFEALKEGKIEIVIGTHGLLNKDVGFKDLGLLIIDEEQKFGVASKEKLRNFKVNVDTLTLTATPIPRTLQFSLMSARDLSIIRTPPPNRQPVHTETRVFSEEVIKDAIYYEVGRGGQVFFVHNRVKTLPDVTGLIQRLCPDVRVGMAHGQMDSSKLEKVLVDFIDKEFDVLVSTNIIETGLDIPNANTIMINNAHQFGLSDLHQLRGRVGRSNKKAFCYLFSPPMSVLTADARKRLKTLEELSDLGSGFDISMRDLDIRGAGNMLGGEQSGFISEIGFDTYQKILEEAIQELKETDFKELFEDQNAKKVDFLRDVQIDTDIEMLIPDEYVESIQERLSLYTQLDHLNTEEELLAFETMLRDRFGKIPSQVYELFDGLRLRWSCKRLGFERVILKSHKLRCYFVENPQSLYYDSPVFQKLFAFIGTQGQRMGLSIKKSNKYLILVKDQVHSLHQAKVVLDKLGVAALDNFIPQEKSIG